MSISNRMHDRLCKLYRLVLVHMKNIEAAIATPSSLRKAAGVSNPYSGHRLEAMEPRVLLSSSAPVWPGLNAADSDTTNGQSEIVSLYDNNGLPENPDEITIQGFSGLKLMSVSTEGTSGDNGSYQVSMSGNGRYVSFASASSNLVEDDTNSREDIFVYDRDTDELSCISMAPNDTQGNGDSSNPYISSTGRYVSFESNASNLVAGDSNADKDIFVYDRDTGLIERVTVSSGDTPTQANGDSYGSSISDNGQFVVFTSRASNLVPDDTNGDIDVFLYDREANEMKLISAGFDGSASNDRNGFTASISADGNYVTFVSSASNLVPDDTNGVDDVFVYDRLLDQIERVSVTSGDSPVEANNTSRDATISADGRYVTFGSQASNLVPGDTNGSTDVFVYDRQLKLMQRVSVSSNGTQGNAGSSTPSISSDGRYVSFLSQANNLVPGDTNGVPDLFVYDRQTNEIERLEVPSDGTGTFYYSTVKLSISDDGGSVGFTSFAGNLVPDDTNGLQDVFVVDRDLPEPEPEIEVKGNGLLILDDDLTPSVADGTDFGATTLGQDTVSRTFTIYNTGSAELLITGLSAPAGYSILDERPDSIPAGGNVSITIRLDTYSTGTKSGFVSITSDDSDESYYSFAVTGVVNSLNVPNLTVTIDESKIPTSILAGTSTDISLPITVVNAGSSAVDPNATIEIQVIARPVGGGDDVLVATLTDQSVSNLGAGKSKVFKYNYTLPDGIAANDYVFVVKVDTQNLVNETDEDDNETVGEVTLTIVESNVNLTATLDERKIPTSIVAGTATKISLPITVTNEGNIAVERDVKIDVQIFARPVGGGDDILLTTLTDQSISNLKEGKSKTLKATFTLPADVATNDYVLVAMIDSAEVVDESNEDDNEAVGEVTVAIAEGNVNLTAALDERKIPTDIVAGTATKISLPISVTNEGNIAVERNVKIDVQIFARPVGGGDDILLTTLTDQSISNLKEGKSKTLKATFTLPADVATNDYVLVAMIDSADVVDESDEDDNEAVGIETVAIAEGHVNLTAAVDDSRIATSLVAGSLKRITLPVIVTNEGNIGVERNVKISMQILARPSGGGDDILLATLTEQSISNLKAGKSKTLRATFTLSAEIPANDYVFVAMIDTLDTVAESNEGDNSAVGSKTIAIA